MEVNNYFIPLLLRHLKLMDIKCDPKELQLVLESAPSFPSILSIVQAYTYFGFKATAYRADYIGLTKASTPAVAHIKQDSSDRFILVYAVSETEVAYYDAFINKEIKISKDDFCTLWTGFVVLSEKVDNNVYHRPLKKSTEYGTTVAIFFLIFFSIVVGSTSEFPLFFCGLLVLKLAGLWLTVGLFRQESRGAYSIFDKFCHRNEIFDCAEVIQSKVSKLFNKVALADVGFVYFTTGIIFLCLGMFSYITTSIIQVLFYLSVCSIPFVIFSIFYQKIVVKKWCPLCLSTMFILMIEVVLFLFFPAKIFTGDVLLTGRIFLFSLFSSTVILFLTKRIIESQARLFKISISTLQLKRTSYVVFSIFGNQKTLSQNARNSLIVGKTEAPITITTLLNPTCIPCKDMALEIIRLLESYPSYIQWHIRLDGVQSLEYDNLNQPQLYLIELFKQNDSSEKRLSIIRKWFAVQSILKLSESYPLDSITEETRHTFYEHLEYNKDLNVEKVPCAWINNRVFPKEYSIRDVPFLLTDIGLLLKSTI